MKQVSEYRKNAAECRAIAKHISLRDDRERLLRIAREWEELANAREAELRKQSKPTPIREK